MHETELQAIGADENIRTKKEAEDAKDRLTTNSLLTRRDDCMCELEDHERRFAGRGHRGAGHRLVCSRRGRWSRECPLQDTAGDYMYVICCLYCMKGSGDNTEQTEQTTLQTRRTLT